MNGPMPEIELLATDFDGTVFRYGNESPLYAAFAERLERLRARGGVWVVCTGRSLGRLRKATRVMARAGIVPDYAITSHYMVFSFSSGIALPLPLLSLRIYMEQMRKARLVQDVVQAMIKDLQEFGHRPRFSTVTRRYMRAQLPSCADAVAAAERLTLMIGDSSVQVHGVDTDVEARGDPIDKGVALMLLAEHIGIGPEKTLTIGDGRTDLPTMQPGVAAWVGCPANSKPEVVERVIRRKGHVARADALTGVIEVIDAFASGVIVSQPPPGWKPPEADLGMPGLFSGQRVDQSGMKRFEAVLLVGTLVAGILVAASFNLIPGGSVVMKPIGWLLERMARLLFL